jgi:hypothetical protein
VQRTLHTYQCIPYVCKVRVPSLGFHAVSTTIWVFLLTHPYILRDKSSKRPDSLALALSTSLGLIFGRSRNPSPLRLGTGLGLGLGYYPAAQISKRQLGYLG